MPKAEPMMTVQVYENGTIHLGKWLVNDGYSGKVDVLRMNHAIMLVRPGATYEQIMDSAGDVKRAYMVAHHDTVVRAMLAGAAKVESVERDGMDMSQSDRLRYEVLQNVVRHVQELERYVRGLV